MFEGGGDDVLGHAIQPLGPFPASVQPPLGEPRVGPPTQEQGLGAQRLVELDLGPLLEVLGPKLTEPAALPEAFFTGRVLDDSIERYVLADHHLAHHSSPFILRAVALIEASAEAKNERRISSRPAVITCDACKRTSPVR